MLPTFKIHTFHVKYKKIKERKKENNKLYHKQLSFYLKIKAYSMLLANDVILACFPFLLIVILLTILRNS